MSTSTTVAPATTRPSPSRQGCDFVRDQKSDDRQDSGYATQSSSPDGQSSASTSIFAHLSSHSGIDPKPRPSALDQIDGLAEFHKPVDDATLARFNHVHTQIEKPLLAYIRSKLPGKRYRPIALRLMVLGRSEDDAKPHIVVLCPEQQSKRINKFFGKTSVQSLCRPEDDALPSFEVLVYGRPPETKDSDQDIVVLSPVVGEDEERATETYCGTPIIVRKPSGVERRCTLGGIIKTVARDGQVKLYGLTVGHVLFEGSDDDVSLGTVGDESDLLDDWSLELSDSEDEDDDEPEGPANEELDGMDNLPPTSQVMSSTESSWASPEMGEIGHISRDSPQYSLSQTDGRKDETKFFYDWALIGMCSYKPNRLRARKLANRKAPEEIEFKSGELRMPETSPKKSGNGQSVILMSGSEGPKRGFLSALPSRLLLGPGEEFVDALVLNLDGGGQVLDGDSGSWVVNNRTLEVYGYLVAVDAFGGGHVITLSQAFRSINNSLKVHSVGLATSVDMTALRLECVLDLNADQAETANGGPRHLWQAMMNQYSWDEDPLKDYYPGLPPLSRDVASAGSVSSTPESSVPSAYYALHGPSAVDYSSAVESSSAVDYSTYPSAADYSSTVDYSSAVDYSAYPPTPYYLPAAGYPDCSADDPTQKTQGEVPVTLGSETASRDLAHCLFPGCTARPFERYSDLHRHYKNAHAPPDSAKETYLCDYPRCARSHEPFRRRDHFRDHLREYHREDFQKHGVSVNEELLEGQYHPKSWWRCPRCLIRVNIAENGFVCPECMGLYELKG